MSEKWNRADALTVRGIIERMGVCGCGTDAHWNCIFELLKRAENHDAHGSFYCYLPQREGKHGESKDPRDEWVEFGAKVLDSWGLLEHGTGIGWAWLTDDGKLLLRFLRDFGLEDWNCDSKPGEGHPVWSIEFSWNETPQPSDSFSEWEAALGRGAGRA